MKSIRSELTLVVATVFAFMVVLGSLNAGPAEKMDIVDTAVSAGDFETLVTAVKAEGPCTVFAPTDAAFAKLPDGTVEGLLEDK